MNPLDLSASDLLVWGIVAHLIADWPLQNDWMARNKARRRELHAERFGGMGHFGYASVWWDRHPAALVHAAMHALALAAIFGWVAAPLALVHLIIDTRWPVVRWSRLIRQTQPNPEPREVIARIDVEAPIEADNVARYYPVDIGTEVRFWTDQVFHIACIAIAALVVA